MKMKLNYPNAIKDERVYKHVPAVKMVYKSEQVVNSECLINRLNTQSYVHFNPQFCQIERGNKIILDFGCELHGQILITTALTEQPVAKVKVTLGESVSECLNTPTLDHAIHQWVLDIPRAAQVYVGNSAFRFVAIEVTEESETPLFLMGVAAVAIYRDYEYLGYFKSNDERLNKIWDIGAYTVHINCQDYIYDGVKRDRLVWIGDLYPEIKTLMSVFEESDLVKKSLDFVQKTTPDELWMNDISSYSCWYLLCHHALYLYRGDFEYLKSHTEDIFFIVNKLLKSVSETNSETLANIRFLDWSTASDENIKHAGLQGLLAYTLQTSSYLANYLNNPKLAIECLNVVKRLQTYVPDCYSNKVAASMQVLGNVGNRDLINREILQVNPTQGLSTFYGYFILQAKTLAGDFDGALELIRKYWGAMIDFGATTFWEDFDLDWTRNAYGIDSLPVAGKDDIHGDFGKYCYQGFRHSLCHGWAGGPTAFLSEYAMGVSPQAPGFKKVSIKPQMGNLTSIEGAIPTPEGLIEISIQKIGNKLSQKVNLPKGIELV